MTVPHNENGYNKTFKNTLIYKTIKLITGVKSFYKLMIEFLLTGQNNFLNPFDISGSDDTRNDDPKGEPVIPGQRLPVHLVSLRWKKTLFFFVTNGQTTIS
jgi:hypothetical protein